MHWGETGRISLSALLVIMAAFFGLLFTPAHASPIQVAEVSICLNVVDLQCQGGAPTFSPDVGKLYCFTRILGAQEPTKIFHVWYYKNKERARVPLEVNSGNWRTYSSKIIQPHETGEWRVEILGPDSELLRVIHFKVVP